VAPCDAVSAFFRDDLDFSFQCSALPYNLVEMKHMYSVGVSTLETVLVVVGDSHMTRHSYHHRRPLVPLQTPHHHHHYPLLLVQVEVGVPLEEQVESPPMETETDVLGLLVDENFYSQSSY